MRILLIDFISNNLLPHLMADNVVYRPDILLKNSATLDKFLDSNEVDAIICQHVPADHTLKQWIVKNRLTKYVCCVTYKDDFSRDRIDFPQPIQGLIVEQVVAKSEHEAYFEAFKTLELRCMQSSSSNSKKIAKKQEILKQKKQVAMIGAGLVNLVTAHRLLQDGYSVEIIDAGPDPRLNAHWLEYGCSRGGDDARMFTLSEMDNYNDRFVSDSMNILFQNDVVQSGWNAYREGSLSKSELSWIDEFEQIPTWLADSYNKDIFSFNKESWLLWEQWIKDAPSLFEDSLIKPDILRIYSDPVQYQSALDRQEKIGATLNVLTADDVATQQPGLAPAVKAGGIAGGVMVKGFTINAHKFMHHLIHKLEKRGIQFSWKTKAQGLVFDSNRRVKGVRTQNAFVVADNYVISPGAYADRLLVGARANAKIHGVLGAWLRIPNLHPQLQHSLKLARKGHITEDANITVATDSEGQPILIIGSGYGHTGIDPTNIDKNLLNQIYLGLVDTAKNYFPEAYKSLLKEGTLESSFKYCVRPWTSTGLGIFEALATTNHGICIITGGHNTGGFTQAPAVAEAVIAAFSGVEHAMHTAYDPDRACIFMHAQKADSNLEQIQSEVSRAE
jgi:glycine/D-amino acid oxidase-like deaminating enzyme